MTAYALVIGRRVRRSAMARGRKTGGGSRRGCPNRFTTSAKEAFDYAFQDLGGRKGLARWARRNRNDFYRLYARQIPQQHGVAVSLDPTAVAERTEQHLARLGELARAGHHVGAAQLYQELLERNSAGSPPTRTTAVPLPTSVAIAPAAESSPPKPTAALASPERATAPPPTTPQPAPAVAPIAQPRKPREEPVVEAREVEPGVWSAAPETPGYPLVVPRGLVQHDDAEALRRRLRGGA